MVMFLVVFWPAVVLWGAWGSCSARVSVKDGISTRVVFQLVIGLGLGLWLMLR